MGNDIEIRVRVANDTGAGLTSLNRAVRDLKQNATQASRGISTLERQTTTAGQSLQRLENKAQGTARALRALGASGDVRITATLDDRTHASVSSIKAAMRDLKQMSPVRLGMTFDGQAGQITAAARSMRDLRSNSGQAGTALDGLATRAAASAVALNELERQAEGASRALRTLRGRAAAAAAAMGELRTSTVGAGNGLRTFNVRADTANTRLGDLGDRTRTLRSDTDDLDGSMRRLTGTLGGLRGRIGTINTSSSDAGGGMEKLTSAAIMLAPALIPVAASLVPIAAGAGAAGIAIGVFGAAVMGQLVAVKSATDAQKKYDDAVEKYGRGSQQAAQAQAEVSRTLAGMPAATQRAAAAVGVLKGQYQQWSKSLAGDTMPVVTKGMAVLGALFPKLTPVVKGASEQMNRFMTILGGGVASGGFSKFMDSFAKFSTGALSKANDGLVRFVRTMSGGTGSSQLSAFMDYARKVGPQVGETLGNLAQALVHLVAAASDTGVSMLGVVNALAKLVNAIPTGALSTLLQFVVVFKAVKMAAAGLAAAGGLSTFATTIGAMRTAAAGATGPLASLGAAFGALSRTAKVALIGTGIGILVIALMKLSSIGKSAPPDVDKMTTALGKLGQTGKSTGEAARVFGQDFSDLGDALRTLARPSNLDKFQQGLVSLIGMDSTPVKESKEAFDGLDKGLTNLVRGGKADLAAAALENTIKALKKQGFTSKEVTSQLDDYKAALADQALEQQLAAQAMGLFGEQSVSVQAKLDAQKQSADGLRQSIEALNDANRNALGGMIGFEASIDAAAKAAKDNHGALNMVNGELDTNSPKAQAAASALNDLAAKTKEAALASREATGSWEGANAIYERGQAQFLKTAQAMGLTSEEAKLLAERIMNIPDKTMRIKMDAEDAKAGLDAFNAAVRKTPGSKSVTLNALSGSAEKVLEALGYHVKRLPNGKVVITAGGNALRVISSVNGAMNAVNGKKASTYIDTYRRTYFQTVGRPGQTVAAAHRPDLAGGGPVRGYASGGELQHFPNGGYVQGPGSPTSDSIVASFGSGSMAAVSDTEYVVQAKSVRKYGVGLLDALNAGRLKLAGFAKGGKLTKAQQRAKAQAEAESQARHDANGQLTISHFGQMAGYQRSEFGSALGKADSISSLVNSLNQWRSIILKSTHGSTESKLLKQLDATGRALLKQEKQLNSVTASLGKAKDRLNDLKSSAASLSSSVRGGVLSSANITKGASSDKTMTVASIMGNATQSRDKAKAFAQALKELKAKGLDKGLIEDIANAGIEGGGLETAGALMGASSSEISSLNTLRSQTATYAKSAGGTAADAVYGAAIKAQTLVVKQLSKSQENLKKSMDRLAKAMEKAVEQAFKKKANGGIVGAASGGLRGGLTWVGEEGPELVRLPASSTVYPAGQSRQKAAAPWSSMLNEARRAPASGATAGGGSQEVKVVLEVRGTTNSRYEEFLLTEIRRMVRARGGIEPTFAPPRGR
ncbi:phage tail protein [Streptomyces sp. NBC_00151]|uniref:phage tail protein n=1 Tax=Streptomyces sp. NBC_00151 TaxID=2975669 RepID=UPI002DDB4ADF|nr:phage tail protein [Streptomyces sp. NBC_00151]WRZ41878.1 phage tail protein [Streptomyces sp. NBC_00151]